MLGAVMALMWNDVPGQTWSLLLGWVETGARGEPLWREMLPRCGRTLSLVIAAAGCATAMGTMAAFAAASLGKWPARVAIWFGQLLAAVPVAGGAWCLMAWLVNDRKLPVESLIPYSPPAELDTWALALGRWVWAWVVPFWSLVLPLSGLWMSELAERLRLSWPLAQEQALLARGLAGWMVRWNHWLRGAWTPLVDRWLRLCTISLGYAAGIESVLGIPGWGSFAVAHSVDTGGNGTAVAIYTGGWMMAGLCVAANALKSWRRHREAGCEGQPPGACLSQALPANGSVVIAWLAPVLIWLLAVQPAPAGWMKAVMAPWLESLLPHTWVEPVTAHLPALMAELQRACGLALQAGLLSVAVGTMAWGIRRAVLRPLPRLEWLAGLAWSPLLLLVFILPGGSSGWEAVTLLLLVADGARQWRGHCLTLEVGGYVQAAKALGLVAGRSVWRHGRFLLMPWLVGWMLRVTGAVILWHVAVDSVIAAPGTVGVSPDGKSLPASMGASIAAASSRILTDVPGMVWPTVLTALIVWIFWRLSSVVSAVRPVRPKP